MLRSLLNSTTAVSVTHRSRDSFWFSTMVQLTRRIQAIDLDGQTTNAAGYFIVGNSAVPGVDLTFPNNILQNGEDAVALYAANATNFPTGTAVTTANLRDAVVYDTADPDDPGLLVLLNAGQPQVDESKRHGL